MATGSLNKTVQVWEIATGMLLQVVRCGAGFIRDIFFSNDEFVVSVSDDDLDILCDVLSRNVWNETPLLKDYTYPITATQETATLEAALRQVSLSPDRNWVIKGCEKILWLPWEYQPTGMESWARRESTLFIGYFLNVVADLLHILLFVFHIWGCIFHGKPFSNALPRFKGLSQSANAYLLLHSRRRRNHQRSSISRSHISLFFPLLFVCSILHNLVLAVAQNLTSLLDLPLLLKHLLDFAQERGVLTERELKVFVFDLLTSGIVSCPCRFEGDGLHEIGEDLVENSDGFRERVLNVAVRIEQLCYWKMKNSAYGRTAKMERIQTYALRG
ncbi:hypothetical protein HG530_009130 [Fusarium avenaceum]|nr:hypothetical protein HG530_009130 [Fusarium avenaceum]